MYSIKIITKDKLEINHIIGEQYIYIHREMNYDKFSDVFLSVFNKRHIADLDPNSDKDTKLCYGFICSKRGIIPLYKNQKAFIINNIGKTHSHLNYYNEREI